jgi:hypothetical protein
VTPPPAELPPGRTDEMVTLPRNQTAGASIMVILEDPDGNRLSSNTVSLAVNSPGLGWQVLTDAPQALGEGRLLFRKLYAGEYRVRNENVHYRSTDEVVVIGPEEERTVKLVLSPAERARVEFFIRLATGDIPQFVTIQILAGTAAEPAGAGRFGKTHGTQLMAPGSVHSSTSRYAPDRTTGMIPFTVAVGSETRFVFASSLEQTHYGAEVTVQGQPGLQQRDVTLVVSDIGKSLAGDGEPRRLARIEITLTLDGKVVNFTRVNLRAALSDLHYRDPSRREGNLFVWENIMSGRWWLAVEGREFHAAHVQQVEIGGAEQITIDIVTGRLRVSAHLDGKNGGFRPLLYNVRLRPEGAGHIERAFNGNLTGKETDHIDFVVPAGSYEITVGRPDTGTPVAADPPQRQVTVTGGGNQTLDFTIRPAAKVEFQALNGAGQPVAGVEFLFTRHPAGSVPESERQFLGKGGVDGRCSTGAAPSGAVYLMIWTASTDWNNPDRVFRLDLPAHGDKDLGGLVVAP